MNEPNEFARFDSKMKVNSIETCICNIFLRSTVVVCTLLLDHSVSMACFA